MLVNHTAPGRAACARTGIAYPEVFIVHDGEATFTVDGVRRRARRATWSCRRAPRTVPEHGSGR